MADEIGQAEIKTDWPVDEGLTAGTQKQTGRTTNLIAEEGSLVRRDEKELL